MQMENIKNYKITVIGDSVSKGLILNNGKIEKLETNAINIINNYYSINIENNSIFGQSLKRVCEKKIIDNYINKINNNENNLLIISLGGNDSDYDWLDCAKTPNEPHTSKTPIDEFNQYLDEITKKLLDNNIKVVFTTLFPINSDRYFKNVISKTADSSKVLEFLHQDVSNIYRHQELFNDIICFNANKYNCKVIDIRSFFLYSVNYLDYVANDGIHPNLKGQKFIAQTIINQLEKMKA